MSLYNSTKITCTLPIDHSEISLGITEEDLNAIAPIFWRKPKQTARRCKQAWLNRLKRFAAELQIEEANLLIRDCRWSIADTTVLWKRVSPDPEKKWKTKSRPWDFLIQYIYRTDIPDNLVDRAHELGKCKHMRANFQPTTGYRIVFLEGADAATRKQEIEDLVKVTGHWFSHLATISDEGLSLREMEEGPTSVHQPLEAKSHDLPIVLVQAMVSAAIQKTWHLGRFRFFKIYTDPPGQLPGRETQFIPWESESYATFSGTILVGGQGESGGPLQMFLVNTHDWAARYVGALMSSKSVQRVLASHYASLSAVYRMSHSKD